MVAAISVFFKSGKLLKESNATIISLVPKCLKPTKVTDFRPISGCNILRKSISKILANRLNKCLPSIISWNQCAFIEERKILDNVLAEEIKKLSRIITEIKGSLDVP